MPKSILGSKIKIANFSDNFYPEMSGISDSIIITAKELAKLGHEIIFFVPKYSQKNYALSHLAPEEITLDKNIKIYRFFSLPYPGPTSQSRLVVPSFWRWLKAKKFNPDIVHTHLFFGAGIEALLTARLLKKPLIGTSHTPISEFIENNLFNFKFLRRFGRCYTAWYYNRCKFVSAPSQSIITEMAKNGFHAPGQVISNPIPLNIYNSQNSQARDELKKKFGLSENAIVYTGRLAPEKHIDIILRAVALIKEKIPNISLAVTGHGSAAQFLEKLAADLKIADNVKFLGYIKTFDMPSLYHASEIFVVASTAETQCMSMLNAMASGLPAVGVNARALPEYINADNGRLVQPGDYTAMAKEILYLFEHPEERKTLGQNAARYVQKFSAPAVAKEWEQIYRKTISASI